MDKYQEQAQKFLKKHKINIEFRPLGERKATWDNENYHATYLVTFKREGKEFDITFYQSREGTRTETRPKSYDILATIQKYPVGDVWDFISEYGYKPSRETDKTHKKVVEEWDKVNEFFTKKELEELREIQ